uniref:class I SAM-dependent methyltransferase n=1 Tax=uncultured Draconibacterium sp. TaxID=1573823 RepID=UPI00321762C3
MDRKKHWENIYETKKPDNVSWYQAHPTVSLNFLKEFAIPKSEKIIDIGGGDSLLVDHLLELGYTDITVLDISEAALDKAKQRLGTKASKIKWIAADAATFKPTEKYGFWHDRAAFHFLTKETEIKSYISTIQENLKSGGVLVIGTFSENGPKMCSGIEIKQYSENSMTERLKQSFEKVKCIHVDHKTPFESIQEFIFCGFRRRTSDS